jgi:hypothetical protein
LKSSQLHDIAIQFDRHLDAHRLNIPQPSIGFNQVTQPLQSKLACRSLEVSVLEVLPSQLVRTKGEE